MDGISLANALIKQKRVNILFISGQSEPSLNKSMITNLNFLRKPYRLKKIINMVGRLCQQIIATFFSYLRELLFLSQ